MNHHAPRRLLTEKQVGEFIPRKRTALKDAIKDDFLTPPLVLPGGRTKVWPADEIAAINEAIIAGKSENELREIVRNLVAARAVAPATVQ